MELAFNACIAGRTGLKEDAVSALASLHHAREHRYVAAITLCWLTLALGQDDAAKEWLRKAAHDAEPYLAWAHLSPMYERLRERGGAGDLKPLLATSPTIMASSAREASQR